MTQQIAQNEWSLNPGISRIFFIGIGGISMSGLAEISRNIGFVVAGSDQNPSVRTEYLIHLGIPVSAGHRAEQIDAFRPGLVVYTAAVHDDNPELIRARELEIKTVSRASFLGWLNRRFSRVVNIAGTHGKTTTTALCSLILVEAGIDPTVHLGAELIQFHGTIRLGRPRDVLVSEACEYMRSFLQFYSTTAAILNIEYDHVDCYDSLKEVISTFAEFADRLPAGGILVIPAYDPNVREMMSQLLERRRQSEQPMPQLCVFGAENDRFEGRKPDFYYRDLDFSQGLPIFEIWHEDRLYCRQQMLIPGQHNVNNALAATACAFFNGGTADAATRVLSTFRGAEGRFTNTGYFRGAQVIADYAHHPSAVHATLTAASYLSHKHVHVIFQPLTYSRTRVLLDDFADVLKDCEKVILAEIFSDRETNPGDISSAMLAKRINDLGGNAVFAASFAAIREQLDPAVQPGDLILVLGPEDIRGFADQLTGRSSHLG